MSKFTDKDYERAAAEAEEAIGLAAVDSSWPEGAPFSAVYDSTEPLRRFEGASFSAGDDIPRLFPARKPRKCSPASSRS